MKAVVGFLVALSVASVVSASTSGLKIDRVETKDLGYVTGEEYTQMMQQHGAQISASMDCGKNGGNIWSTKEAMSIPWPLVINLGKELWAIIQSGQPTYQESYDIATALPAGTKCWNELNSWKKPVVKRFQYRFFAGTSYTTLKLAVAAVTGGKKAGKGAYIGYASAIPEDMRNTGVFNKLSINVAIPWVGDESNDDSTQVGSMLMTVRVANESPLFDRVEGKMIHIGGNGVIDLSDEEAGK